MRRILLTITLFCYSTLILFSQESKFNIVNDGWGVSLAAGLTHYNHDFSNSNISNSYEFGLIKKIDNYISLSTQFNFINLKGARENPRNQDVYNPYGFYEFNGDFFVADIYEASLIVSANIYEGLLLIDPTIILLKRLNIFYSIGVGELWFRSMRYNAESNSYIYGYGYNDVHGDFYKKKKKLPKARVFYYGFSVKYKISKDFTIYCSTMIHSTDTEYIDLDESNNKNDKFRNILLGVVYEFDFLKAKHSTSSIIPK